VSANPELSVVVASHDRALRLRWLLNALEQQTLARERWEVIVAHDSDGPETERLLGTHPLARRGSLRQARLSPGGALAGAKRNAALRLARGELVVFTDEDCRPPPDWLENALAAARRSPGAIVQGTTARDPTELVVTHAPHVRSETVRPPTVWAQACNIVYPRRLIEEVGGFDEHPRVGEDTDLALRVRALGTPYLAAPEVVTYRGVAEQSLWQVLRGRMRWRDVPYLLKRHPQLRESLPLWIFWRRSHVWLPFFLAGVYLVKRDRLALVMCVPWLAHRMPTRGTSLRSRLRAVSELPLRLAVDTAEYAAFIRGSIRHRTLLL
jgi:GT2 family glycosyltransferase